MVYIKKMLSAAGEDKESAAERIYQEERKTVNTLIAYASKKGFTYECAAALQQQINGKADLLDLAAVRKPDISGYNGVIIGGSIRASRLNRTVKRFCEMYAEELADKQAIGLFLCGLEKEKMQEYLHREFPQLLTEKAAAVSWLGGRMDLSQYNALTRWFLKRIMQEKDQEIKELIEVKPPGEAEEFLRKYHEVLNSRKA